MIASLPMYDWPEIRAETDGLWQSVRAALGRGPDRLTRPETGWMDDDVLLSQTCGLPFVTRLSARLWVVGAGDYGLADTPPGWYRSALVVRRDDQRRTLPDFRGAILAANSTDSQSGWQAVMQMVAPLARDGAFFGAVRLSGAHRASIRMVAEGDADLAAIDAVSWRLAERHEPAAGELRVLGLTECAPGLPFVTRDAPDDIAEALASAIGPDIKRALGLRRVVRLTASDYTVISERAQSARQITTRHLEVLEGQR
ncbi:MAG: PhnD/SsuA/transferrin family substrate-binding protein [Pseudomonadota bacterium]